MKDINEIAEHSVVFGVLVTAIIVIGTFIVCAFL